MPRQRGGSAGKSGLHPSSSQMITITMTALRLPLVRFSKCTISNTGVRRVLSEFSTTTLRQVQHPAPASTSNRFLPRFLDPSIYWRGSKPISKIKGLQGPKPWNPATFYIVRQCLRPPLDGLSMGNSKADIRSGIGYVLMYRLPGNPNDRAET